MGKYVAVIGSLMLVAGGVYTLAQVHSFAGGVIIFVGLICAGGSLEQVSKS